jgi:predicted protein tyrosine phosphatase
MKRCIFHVPVKLLNVVCVQATSDDDAWDKLARGEDVELLYSFVGETKENKPELITCIEMPQRRGKKEGEEK